MSASLIDSGYLSAYLNVPQPTIDNLLDGPTSELVQGVLEAVASKAREYEELEADKMRLAITYENTVRSSETIRQDLKATADKALIEANELRGKVTAEENSRATLETELQNLKNTSSTSSSEAETLRARIASLEAANRDTLAVLESKSTANDTLAQDLQKQHQKSLELSQQVSALQQQVQNANSTVSSAKFREQSLQQELEQIKRNNEWLDTELKTKSAEALKYRKEKGARIAELQRLNEEANANLEASKRTESALRSRLDEVQRKADESFVKVQQLQELAATTEEGFRQELESSRRLADLQSQQAETHRTRLQEVESQLEATKDDAIAEINRCREEVEAESQERQRLEQQVSELELEIDRLQASAAAPAQVGSAPGTPRRGVNGSVVGTPGSIRTKTQTVEELFLVQKQLMNERVLNQRLTREMDEIMQGLEAKQPEIEELQAEHERLQQEVVEMSKFVDQTGKERDRAKKDARKAESELTTAQAEANILRQQLRDLSAQVKLLLCELNARERGLDSLNAAEQAQLERLAKGEVSEEALEGLTDTDRFISQRLTVFRNISELQEKNQELLKITRQLGAQMESEEALAAKHQAAKDHEQVKVLEARIEHFKDEIKSITVRGESYVKERDMFRRMLQHRGQLPPNADLASMFDQSVAGSDAASNVGQSPSKDNADYAKLLRDLQTQFDQYREVQATDRHTMKTQMDELGSEKSSLQSELAKASSQVTLATERYEMLHANYTLLQNENSELQKRSQTLSEAAAKQDLRTQQVAEDLVEAKSLVESMRNETANLKAEKELWRQIQDRMNQDNENLMNERNRVNNLLTSQQNLSNERELADSETRRRLQAQVENLETELSTTKRKLGDEVEDHKKTQLRKEYDAQQSQKRIDDLASSLSSIREELVAAKTTRDHLQARVDELTIELKSAEERVEVLQPRPTPRPGSQLPPTDLNAEEDATLTREQELAIEVSELKRDLELARSELESVKAQMEQYKAISQAAEEELQSFNESHDQYHQEMDGIVKEKNSRIRELEQRVEDISSELSSTNTELNKLRNDQSDVVRRVAEEKGILEAEIIRLRDEDERHATAAQFHQRDLRAQAEIATKAQQSYEQELVKHAEATKLLQNLRVEYNQLKTESAELKAEAESAKVALSQSQTSWDERREQFERELSELRTRRDDVSAQNNILLQQLESVTAQVAALQQSRRTLAEEGETEGTPSGTGDRAIEGLRELVGYLRREKEIVDVQYDMSIQEAKRLKQQLEYAQSQLDEARLKLDQERRSQADGSRSNIAHKDLMEKLNELNLFRESSITLRNEARQAQTQLSEKTKQLEDLMLTIQPLETKVRELENSKEMQDGEIKLLQEDRDRWQKRNQEILSKYDRIDPAEMEQLKESIAVLQTERDELKANQQPLEEKVQTLEQTLETEKATWQATRAKIVEQAKERSRVLTKDRNDRIAERDAAIKDKESLEQQLSTKQQELESTIEAKQNIEQQLSNLQAQSSSTKAAADGGSNGSDQANSGPSASVAQATPQIDSNVDEQLTIIRNELETALAAKKALEEQLTTLRQELEAARAERDQALADAAQATAEAAAKPSDVPMQNGVNDVQGEAGQTTQLSEDERKALEQRIATAEAKAKEQEDKAKEAAESMEATLKQRSEKMKATLNKKLAESKESTKASLEAEYALKLEQERQIWLAENKIPASTSAPAPTENGERKDASTAPPPTPATPAAPTSTSTPDLSNLSDSQMRELLSTNPTARSILASNIKKKIEVETQKLKEEHEKAREEQEKAALQKLTDAEKKAEEAKNQAVLMEGKKSALKVNMADNRFKTANAKLQVVEKAATETPEKPVGEVWEIAKNAKPPTNLPAPNVAAPTAQASQANLAPAVTVPPPEVKAETVAQPPASDTPQQQPGNSTTLQPPAQPASDAPSAAGTQTNNGPSAPTSNIPVPQSQQAGPPRTGIPTRGGASIRGRGPSGTYQAPRGGAAGRGRGAPNQRGGGNLNPGAQNFSPTAGNKRPRDSDSQNTGAQQGNAGKRIRGGGAGN